VKRWQYIVLAAAVVAAIFYVYSHWGGQGLGSMFADRTSGSPSATRLQWRTIERPGDGFKVEFPAEENERQAPAYNEKGAAEPVRMLVANPNGDVTFAVTWEDNPPVARVSHTPERTLNMARDGMLARTETTIVSESRGFARDYPSLEMLARNGSGGILNARLILADNRLYVLMALFPSADARRERDVARFFSSFVPARPSAIPESMPAASTD
jgi:hypothetical protein